MSEFEEKVIAMQKQSEAIKYIYDSECLYSKKIENGILNYVEIYLGTYTPLVKERIDKFCEKLNPQEIAERSLYKQHGYYNISFYKFWHIPLGISTKSCISNDCDGVVDIDKFTTRYTSIFFGQSILDVMEAFKTVKSVYEEVLISCDSKSIYEDLIKENAFKIDIMRGFISEL